MRSFRLILAILVIVIGGGTGVLLCLRELLSDFPRGSGSGFIAGMTLLVLATCCMADLLMPRRSE